MKFRPLIASIATLTLINGCAQLALFKDSEPEQELDPVAAAAARLRSPAGLRAAAPSPEAREAEELRREHGYAPENIALGMPMREVIALWGEPRDIESAGDPSDGNQRWTYFSGLSSRWSLSDRRIVYFEGGRVAGWKTGN